MKALYGIFLKPGSLAFDIGSHLGNRIRAFAGLGARVVALEPASESYRFIRKRYGSRENITCVHGAAGTYDGTAVLYKDPKNPTLSTVSPSWMNRMKTKRSFRNVAWREKEQVPMITLDGLIGKYGTPDFCKIDTEGTEDQVLAGCSEPLPAVSFEYLPMEKETALRCLRHLEQLGRYRYNVSVRETMRFRWADWAGGDEISRYLDGLTEDAPSGDVYAVRQGGGKNESED